VAAEQLEEVPILLATVTSVISQLKNQLQQQYERAYPDLSDIIRYVIDAEEANAWALSSLSPHLFLPDLVEAHMAQLGLGPFFDRRENVPAPLDSPQIEEHPAQAIEQLLRVIHIRSSSDLQASAFSRIFC
jgi:hypothetical protein